MFHKSLARTNHISLVVKGRFVPSASFEQVACIQGDSLIIYGLVYDERSDTSSLRRLLAYRLFAKVLCMAKLHMAFDSGKERDALVFSTEQNTLCIVTYDIADHNLHNILTHSYSRSGIRPLSPFCILITATQMLLVSRTGIVLLMEYSLLFHRDHVLPTVLIESALLLTSISPDSSHVIWDACLCEPAEALSKNLPDQHSLVQTTQFGSTILAVVSQSRATKLKFLQIYNVLPDTLLHISSLLVHDNLSSIYSPKVSGVRYLLLYGRGMVMAIMLENITRSSELSESVLLTASPLSYASTSVFDFRDRSEPLLNMSHIHTASSETLFQHALEFAFGSYICFSNVSCAVSLCFLQTRHDITNTGVGQRHDKYLLQLDCGLCLIIDVSLLDRNGSDALNTSILDTELFFQSDESIVRPVLANHEPFCPFDFSARIYDISTLSSGCVVFDTGFLLCIGDSCDSELYRVLSLNWSLDASLPAYSTVALYKRVYHHVLREGSLPLCKTADGTEQYVYPLFKTLYYFTVPEIELESECKSVRLNSSFLETSIDSICHWLRSRSLDSACFLHEWTLQSSAPVMQAFNCSRGTNDDALGGCLTLMNASATGELHILRPCSRATLFGTFSLLEDLNTTVSQNSEFDFEHASVDIPGSCSFFGERTYISLSLCDIRQNVSFATTLVSSSVSLDVSLSNLGSLNHECARSLPLFVDKETGIALHALMASFSTSRSSWDSSTQLPFFQLCGSSVSPFEQGLHVSTHILMPLSQNHVALQCYSRRNGPDANNLMLRVVIALGVSQYKYATSFLATTHVQIPLLEKTSDHEPSDTSEQGFFIEDDKQPHHGPLGDAFTDIQFGFGSSSDRNGQPSTNNDTQGSVGETGFAVFEMKILGIPAVALGNRILICESEHKIYILIDSINLLSVPKEALCSALLFSAEQDTLTPGGIFAHGRSSLISIISLANFIVPGSKATATMFAVLDHKDLLAIADSSNSLSLMHLHSQQVIMRHMSKTPISDMCINRTDDGTILIILCSNVRVDILHLRFEETYSHQQEENAFQFFKSIHAIPGASGACKTYSVCFAEGTPSDDPKAILCGGQVYLAGTQSALSQVIFEAPTLASTPGNAADTLSTLQSKIACLCPLGGDGPFAGLNVAITTDLTVCLVKLSQSIDALTMVQTADYLRRRSLRLLGISQLSFPGNSRTFITRCCTKLPLHSSKYAQDQSATDRVAGEYSRGFDAEHRTTALSYMQLALSQGLYSDPHKCLGEPEYHQLTLLGNGEFVATPVLFVSDLAEGCIAKAPCLLECFSLGRGTHYAAGCHGGLLITIYEYERVPARFKALHQEQLFPATGHGTDGVAISRLYCTSLTRESCFVTLLLSNSSLVSYTVSLSTAGSNGPLTDSTRDVLEPSRTLLFTRVSQSPLSFVRSGVVTCSRVTGLYPYALSASEVRFFITDLHASIYVYELTLTDAVPQLLFVGKDCAARRTTTSLVVIDRNTIAVGDRFGSVSLLRLAADTPNVLSIIAELSIGIPIMSLFLCNLETSVSLVYAAVDGSIGMLCPVAHKETFARFLHAQDRMLERSLYKQDAFTLSASSHDKYRRGCGSFYNVVDLDYIRLMCTSMQDKYSIMSVSDRIFLLDNMYKLGL